MSGQVQAAVLTGKSRRKDPLAAKKRGDRSRVPPLARRRAAGCVGRQGGARLAPRGACVDAADWVQVDTEVEFTGGPADPVTRCRDAKRLHAKEFRGQQVRYGCCSGSDVQNRERPRTLRAASGIGEARRLTRPPRPWWVAPGGFFPPRRGVRRGRRPSPFLAASAASDRARMRFRGADDNRGLPPFEVQPGGVRGLTSGPRARVWRRPATQHVVAGCDQHVHPHRSLVSCPTSSPGCAHRFTCSAQIGTSGGERSTAQPLSLATSTPDRSSSVTNSSCRG